MKLPMVVQVIHSQQKVWIEGRSGRTVTNPSTKISLNQGKRLSSLWPHFAQPHLPPFNSCHFFGVWT